MPATRYPCLINVSPDASIANLLLKSSSGIATWPRALQQYEIQSINFEPIKSADSGATASACLSASFPAKMKYKSYLVAAVASVAVAQDSCTLNEEDLKQCGESIKGTGCTPTDKTCVCSNIETILAKCQKPGCTTDKYREQIDGFCKGTIKNPVSNDGNSDSEEDGNHDAGNGDQSSYEHASQTTTAADNTYSTGAPAPIEDQPYPSGTPAPAPDDETSYSNATDPAVQEENPNKCKPKKSEYDNNSSTTTEYSGSSASRFVTDAVLLAASGFAMLI